MIAVILSRQAGSREATERRRTAKDLKMRRCRRSHAVSAQVAYLEILRPRFAGLRMTKSRSAGVRGCEETCGEMTSSAIFSMVPSLTSTDKSVCATLILPYTPMLRHARVSVAQTLLSVLWQDALSDVVNRGLAAVSGGAPCLNR
jgi:hypothetical protein